ncbi:MAG: cytochrome c1 [Betaproteobacteria bacterium]|nr:cytochrome c1 [Betaproteobacteria bacterium]
MNRTLKTLLALCLFAPALAWAATAVNLDRAPDRSGDNAALQNGAKLFVNYCLSCHGASGIRYNRLMELGLTKEQIEDNLIFTSDKIGSPMRVAMRHDEAKKWLGVAPLDLSLIARARGSADGSGADWLYTYLRSFYRDDTRPTGWNNHAFDSVGMPHILYQMQETLTADKYDEQVADLVGFLVWMGEPQAGFRKNLGIGILLFLVVLLAVSYALKKEYWKDVH